MIISNSNINVIWSWRMIELCCSLLLSVEGADPDRRDKLIELLDIDLQWRMHKVSDGQRRRVQICLGLLYPYKVLFCLCTSTGQIKPNYITGTLDLHFRFSCLMRLLLIWMLLLGWIYWTSLGKNVNRYLHALSIYLLKHTRYANEKM